MTWASFYSFWGMRALGCDDTVYRNYDLLYINYGRDIDQIKFRDTQIKLAAKLMGLTYSSGDVTLTLNTITQRIYDICGVTVHPNSLRLYVVEWFIWYRITTGVIKSFPLRSTAGARAQKRAAVASIAYSGPDLLDMR